MLAVTAATAPACSVLKGVTPANNCARSPAHVAKVETFYIIGHRGAAMKAVENTLPSFDKALELGANGLELDLCLTKDGHIVVWHDWEPDTAVALLRQAGKEPNQLAQPKPPSKGDPFRKPIDQLTLEEVQNRFDYEVDGKAQKAHIPTLEEMLDWAKDKAPLKLVMFDLKIPEDKAELADVMIPRIREAVAARGLKFTYVMLTPYEKVYERASALIPDAALSFDVDPGLVAVQTGTSCNDSSSHRAIGRGRGYASTVMPTGFAPEAWDTLQELLPCDLDARDRTTPAVAPAKVFVATLDDKDPLECVMDMGVDGVVTDDPSKVHAIASSRGRLTP